MERLMLAIEHDNESETIAVGWARLLDLQERPCTVRRRVGGGVSGEIIR